MLKQVGDARCRARASLKAPEKFQTRRDAKRAANLYPVLLKESPVLLKESSALCAASPMLYVVSAVRGSTERLSPVGRCIYCGKGAPSVRLTDEHVIADGLGGNLLLPDASCLSCAQKTGSAEQHLLRQVLRVQRAIVGVQSRKRKPTPQAMRVQRDADGTPDERDYLISSDTPFLLPFITTDLLPGIMRGAPADETPVLRLALFGPPDWHERGRKWLKGTGKFKAGGWFHAGIVGQALAKTAHAYASAMLGPAAFTPLLTEYIAASEPPFNGHLIGSYPTQNILKPLHLIDIRAAHVPRSTAFGTGAELVYVVILRLFANQPSPRFLIVVGRPVGPVSPSIVPFQGYEAS